MANVSNIFLIASTGDSKNDGSSDSISLGIVYSSLANPGNITFNSTGTKWGSKSSKGDAKVWQYNIPSNYEFTEADITTVNLTLDGNNKWVPVNIFLLVTDTDGVSTMLSAYPNWDSPFSEDQDEGEPTQQLYPQT